jgi:CheY-like chemotaxis protein
MSLSEASRRALVVEDDDDVRDVLNMLLTVLGFAVDEATNGREALERLRENLPDLIVLDLMMPVMNGWTFRAEQKKIEGARDIPVIILSARRPPYREVEALEGAEVLPKPFELDTFLKAVARHFPEAAEQQPEWLGAGVATR